MNSPSSNSITVTDRRIRILLVDAVSTEQQTIARFLQAWNFHPVPAAEPVQALKLAAAQEPSIAIVAEPLAGYDTMLLVRSFRENMPATETLLITNDGSAKFATDAFRAGVYNCLQRPLDFKQLGRDLNTLREAVQRRRERTIWDRAANGSLGLGEMLGFSAPMQAVFAAIRRFASEESPVLITGSTGAGKEIAAKTIHSLSTKAAHPLITYRCCGVSPELANMELFGEGKMAGRKKAGDLPAVIELARGGTLFLDEVADLPASIQEKLQKVLDETVSPQAAGPDSRTIRVIAATRFNLAEMALRGQFNGPLCRLLSRNIVHLPSLTERTEDVPLLCRQFVETANREFGKQIQGFSPAAERVLLAYGWPGNVRELQNVIERAALLADHEWIDLADLSITSALDPQHSMAAEWPAEPGTEPGRAPRIHRKRSPIGFGPAAKAQ